MTTEARVRIERFSPCPGVQLERTLTGNDGCPQGSDGAGTGVSVTKGSAKSPHAHMEVINRSALAPWAMCGPERWIRVTDGSTAQVKVHAPPGTATLFTAVWSCIRPGRNAPVHSVRPARR